MRIMIIEDEQQLAKHIINALVRHGHKVSAHTNGATGLQAALDEWPDLILLDLNLPGLDGLTVLARLQAALCPSRVLILSALSEIEHRITGLKAGADDYLGKPFAMDELVARVEALGRRGTAPVAADNLRLADLQMNVRSRRVTRGEKSVELSPREFDLLHVLLAEPGRVFSRGELCERVWQRAYEYDTRTVEIFITRLRRKVDAGAAVPLIHTVRSVGYTVRA
ncbi:MAG: response regulator transcription factor [Opitutae bacterium]